MLKVAVAQTGSVLFDTAATLLRVKGICEKAAAAGVRLVVFPEALLGGYPKGLDFGAVVGHRSEPGKTMFVRYFKGAVECPGVETEMLAEWAKRLGLHIVIGVIERDGGTLYCTSLLFSPDGLVGKHRKLMPTAMERLIWGIGDGTTMKVVETEIGRNRDGNLLGELHAALPAASVSTGSAVVVCSDGGYEGDVADEYAAYRV